jgi:hypothetical protein
MIDRVQFSTGPAAGAAGSATATSFSPPVTGRLLAVHLAYRDSPPASTAFKLSDESDPAAESIVLLVNANIDTKLYPRRATQDNVGSNVTFDGTNEIYEPYVVHGRLKAVIAGANADDSIDVTVWSVDSG